MSRAHERKRSAPVTLAVLAALQEGPKLNTDLSQYSPTVNDHITFLRQDGYNIECQRIPKSEGGTGGKFLYKLLPGDPPEWDIVVAVTLADGAVSSQRVRVTANTGRQAKSKARNLAASTRVTTAVLIAAVTGNEFNTDDEGH